MSIKEIDALLLRLIEGVDLFKNINLDEVTALLRQASRINFAAGEIAFEEGSEGHSMYIVTQGAFEVYRQSGTKQVHIARVEPGEHFGEIALLANRSRSASVRAIEPSVAIRLSKRAVLAEQKAAVLLFRNMAQLMAKRLIHIDEEVLLHKTGKYAAVQQAAVKEEPEHIYTNTSKFTVVNR